MHPKRCLVLLMILILLPSLCAAETNPDGWNGERYVNQQSGVIFTMPENWLYDPLGLLPNPFFDVLASDQTGANAIAIGFIDLQELVKLIPADALGPYAGLLNQIDWSNIDAKVLMNMMASMFTSGSFGADVGITPTSILMGEMEYTLIAIDLYDGALLEYLLLQPAGKQMSVIMFSSSDHTEAEWFLSHFGE